ncbi:MAG: B12-binding domain-containing radical SAM protein [Candidatus Hadarchaeum sp.]|uniref:B12-binding domain-containing radical SAM protein n=1 Tax=Candidatus Hadarchaeum sp. TaxID=2883567 RepID=UPI003D1053A6
MKVLLISPPTESAVTKVMGTTGPPLGLAYLASMIKNEHDVKIVDAVAEGYAEEDVAKIIRSYDPDLIGLTATTAMMPDAYETAQVAKKINENVKIVIGGPHATFLPERTMQECPQVDFVVRGEGEYTFKELVAALEKERDLKNIKGLSFQRDGKVINNPPRELVENVDEIPMPAYDLLPMKKYRAGKIEFGTIITSRGCPFNCIFCSSSLQFGKKWRGHSVARTLEELSILRNEYSKREIEFLDDTFTFQKSRAITITEEIRREGLDITWTASSRVDTFSQEVACAMKMSGAHTVYFGIESASQRTLDFIGKGITPEKSVLAVKNAKRAGLHALGSFVIGFPEESAEEIETTIKFSKKVGVDLAQFTIATPYPGTRLWLYALKEKILLTMNWRKFTTLDPVMKLKYLTADQITKALRSAYLKFYLRPKMLLLDLIRDRGFVFKKAMHFLANEIVQRLK